MTNVSRRAGYCMLKRPSLVVGVRQDRLDRQAIGHLARSVEDLENAVANQAAITAQFAWL